MVKMYSVDVNLNIELTTFKILDIRCLYLASPQTRCQSDALNHSAMKAASDKKVNLPNVKFKKVTKQCKVFLFQMLKFKVEIFGEKKTSFPQCTFLHKI